MTIQEIASKWVEYCSTGQWESALNDLYSEDAVSMEMKGAEGFPERVEGMAAIKEKGEMWSSMVEEFHGIEIGTPIIAADHFAATMTIDVTMKGQPRSKSPEIALFRVADGKIVSEQFFYELG